VGVAEAVKADARQVYAAHVPAKHPLEVIGMDWRAICPDEDEAAIAPRRSCCQAFRHLCRAVDSEGRHGPRAEFDLPTGFRLCKGRRISDCDKRLSHAEAIGFQVDVLPSKPKDLARAHSGGNGYQPRGIEPILLNGCEKDVDLIGVPRLLLPASTHRFSFQTSVGCRPITKRGFAEVKSFSVAIPGTTRSICTR